MESYHHKSLSQQSLILAIITFLLVGAISYLVYQNKLLKQQLNNFQHPQSQACTLEAKICPDGSSVGRTLPNCEFAPCPEISTTPTPVSDPTTDWQTYTNEKHHFSFKYPEGWILRGFDNMRRLQDAKNSTNLFLEKSLGEKDLMLTFSSFLYNEKNNPAPTEGSGMVDVETIGGNLFYKADHPDGEMDDSTPFVVFEINNGKYLVQIQSIGKFPIDQQQRQILSTFKFTD